MDTRIVFEDSEGNCRIINPDPSFKQEWETEEDAIARLYRVAIPESVEFIVCRSSKIPQDRTFRQAWRKGDVNEPVKIDLQTCIKIHRTRVQEAVERKLEKLNQELEIALENDNLPQQVAIRSTKKILRKMHDANMSHCKTPDDVKYCILPEIHDVWTLYPPRRPV